VADLKRLPWRLRYEYAVRAASSARRLSVLATHRHTDVHIHPTAWLGPRFSLWIPAAGRFHAGPGCEFRRDFYAEIANRGVIELGPQVIFTGQATLQITTSLTIGARAALGVGTFIADGNHRYKDHTKHWLEDDYDYTPIVIGEAAAIMTGCTIMASIGKRSAIGANSVVTRPIPDYCLAMGSPARVVEYFGPPELAPPGVKLTKSAGEA
jgi:acetyltransferase-like isoleucine patch superfamily enzyme